MPSPSKRFSPSSLFINPVLCSSSDLEILLFFFCFLQMTLKSQPSMEGFATRAEGESEMSDFLESSGGLILSWASPFLWPAKADGFSKKFILFFFHSCMAHAFIGQSSQWFVMMLLWWVSPWTLWLGVLKEKDSGACTWQDAHAIPC